MLDEQKARVGEKLTESILNTIHYHLSDPDLDQDAGEVKLIDQDQSCLYFGLFETDQETGLLSSDPTIIATVEVFSDIKGGR